MTGDDTLQLRHAKRMERNDLPNTVVEFRSQVGADRVENNLLAENVVFTRHHGLTHTKVGGEEHYGIGEVAKATFGIREPAFVQHCKQEVKDLRMSLLYFIKEHDGVG